MQLRKDEVAHVINPPDLAPRIPKFFPPGPRDPICCPALATMRLSESEVIVDTLSNANTESSGRINVGALLSKPEFVKSLRELWAHIPEKTRRSIGRRPQRNSHGRCRLRDHEPHSSNIALSKTLIASVPHWRQNPSSFFQEGANALDLEVSPIAQLCQYHEQLNNRRTLDTIRARFIKIAFHRLKERLCLQYLRSKDVDDIAWIISKSGLFNRDLDSVKRMVTRWAALGKRLDALCRSIGSSAAHEDSHLGNLFCLPEDCHDEFVRVLNYAGPVRDQQIKRIKDRGILNVQGRADLDGLAADVFGVLWTKITASIDDIVIQSSESDLGRNPQHTHSFRIEQQPSRAMLQPNISLPPDESSQISNTVENVRSGPRSPRHITQGSAVANHVSPTIASVRQQQTRHSYDNITNQLADSIAPHSGHPSSYEGNTVNVHDILQPILPVRDYVEPPPTDTANTVDVHDMIQPILPAHAFSLFDGQSHGDMGDMVNIHDILQPILPVPACELFGGQSQSNMVEMAELHNIVPSIPPTQALDQADRQVPTMDDPTFAPMMTGSQNMHTQNRPFTQPVSAA